MQSQSRYHGFGFRDGFSPDFGGRPVLAAARNASSIERGYSDSFSRLGFSPADFALRRFFCSVNQPSHGAQFRVDSPQMGRTVLNKGGVPAAGLAPALPVRPSPRSGELGA
jgi:hypothetical protein